MSNIDWSQLITAEMKAHRLVEARAAEVQAELATRRAAADFAIAPLQDAVDIDEATDEEMDSLKAWKKYRVALSRIPALAGYPTVIDWPTTPGS